MALTSNYKFRGQDQDTSKNKGFKPAIQGGFDYAFGESGLYIGNWNSSVDWLPRQQHRERHLRRLQVQGRPASTGTSAR